MIRLRQVELDSAVDRAIEWLRAPKPLEEVVGAVLTLLAQAADSLWAGYWVIDVTEQRLRPMMTWSPSGIQMPPFDRAGGLLSLGFSNAAVVWCGRKPVWSTAATPDATLNRHREWNPTDSRGAVWFALRTDTAVYGVIELLGRALQPQPPDSLNRFERLGFRLGLALEESLYRNRPAQTHIFQRGPLA